MSKRGKHNNSKHKSKMHSTAKKKKNKEKEIVNKKAIFNRYKSKQKVEEVLAKKKLLENKFQQQPAYSESEEEEDPYGQLVSCFNIVSKKKIADSEESESDDNKLSDVEDIEVENDSETNEKEDSEMEDHTEIKMNNEENEVVIDQEVANDPFTIHFQDDLCEELVVALSKPSSIEDQITKNWPVLGQLTVSLPKPLLTSNPVKEKLVTILEQKTYASLGKVPHLINNIDFNELHIKSQIQGNIVSANKTNLIKRDVEFQEVFTPLQKELFAIINNYQDLYYPEQSFINADEIRYVYCLHAINHMLKTRTKILHHNAKILKNPNGSDDYRDQGLVRPKVLIIVPFKNAAYKVVKTIMGILVPKEAGQVVNKNRFEEDFTGGELVMPKKNPKPEDYELMFSGNTDDTFRLGMTITKKTLKLYTDFYSSDIIVASPLGLRMIVGAEGEAERDCDFLASLELLVLDQADVFLMQNWDHVLHVLDHMHLQPKKSHGTDFSRVRSWAVNGWSKYYRQTLVFSSVQLPEIKSVLNKKCNNYAGKVLVANPADTGTMQQVLLQIPQIFHRFEASSPLDSVDARFDYFLKEVLPKHRDPLMGHTLIYVPSYFDYVRIRNHFKKEDIGFVQICEYSKESKIARARDMFFHSEAHFLLYSERAHFFRRLRVKGARHVIFYQPPTYPHFYSEICNLMQECNQNKYGGSACNMSVTVTFCRYDLPRLAALTGAERARVLASAERPVHVFLTGEGTR